MVSPAKLPSTSQQVPLSHRVLLPRKIVRVLFSPQSNPFAKFIPQRSHLLLPVFLQLSSPAEITKHYSPTSAQDVTSRHPSRIYFPRQKTYIHKHRTSIHYSMHICIISYNFTYVENIMAWSISWIAYDWPLPFRKDPVKFSVMFKAFSSSVRSTLRSPCFLSSWRFQDLDRFS